MNPIGIQLLNGLQRVYRKVATVTAVATIPSEVNYEYVQFSGQEASDVIKHRLLNTSPAMVCRFGSVELNCLANHLSVKHHKNDYKKFISHQISPFWWEESLMRAMSLNAGFFPTTPENLSKFSELYIQDLKQVDILGSWLHKEALFEKQLSNAVRVQLADLMPLHLHNPWTEALRGKKVLVIHPFVTSIQNQYKKREKLFGNQNILPSFELKTLQAVQSIANNKTSFANWFDALDSMKEAMARIEFDIAVIGCGAYGLPLAAHAKRLGKKGIHLGGATQILFGIIGKRWEENSSNKYIKENFLNEHWVRPLPEETPEGITAVEGGCYW